VDAISWRNKVMSRYRCRECDLQFWVISRRSYILVASLLCALLLAGIGVFVLDFMVNSHPAPGSQGVSQVHMPRPGDIRPMVRAQIAAFPSASPALRPT
jgi:hypothetical protein